MNNIIKRKWNQNSMVIIEDLQGMAFQAESGGHTFQISGIDGEGNTVALSGTPAGVMLRADGQDVTLTCSVSGGVVSATLPANAYVVPGRFGLTIFLTSDGQKTAIYAAVGTVGKTSSGTVAPPAGSDVVTLVNQINTAIAAIPVNFNAAFAPAYSDSGLYSVGQYVTYNGTLYRCITPVTTSGTWSTNSSKFTAATLGNDVYDLKSAISGLPKIFTLSSTSSVSRQFQYDFYVGNRYTITNNTASQISFQTRETKTGSTVQDVGNISSGGSKTFICNANAHWFNSWCPSVGNISILETNSQLINVENKAKEYDAELEKALTYNKSRFTVYTEHLSQNDRVDVSIAVGESLFAGYVSSVTNNIQVSLSIIYTDDTSKTIAANVVYIADKAIKQVAAYVRNNSGTPTDFILYVFTGNISDIYKKAEYANRTSKLQILFLDNENVVFSANKKSFLMPGTSCYIGYNSYRYTINYSDILNKLPNYATQSENGITITMPSEGCFGFNISDKEFKMITGFNAMFNTNEDFVPLYYRYYDACFGFLSDKFIFDNVHRIVVGNGYNIIGRMFNSAFHSGATDFDVKCKEFSSLLLGDSVNNVTAPSDFESFVFFTDPHLTEFSGWENRCYEFIAQIQKYYNSTPTTFCLCGGDWLGNSDLPDVACYKLGYIDGFMHSMFNNCYMLVGNHDTNYQGRKDSESSTGTTRLSNQSIADLWYRNEKKAYFTFNGVNTKFYCFDTGTENQPQYEYNNYGWDQVDWFANALLTDNSPHIAVALHIIYYSGSNIQPLTESILQIAQAYNNRTTITKHNHDYDYSSATGKIEFCIGGHKHTDENALINGIPCVMTTNVRANESKGATFDLCVADYDNGLLKMIRIGDGDNRTIGLATGELVT